MKIRLRNRILYYALLVYVILFFGWWIKLLSEKNTAEYFTRIELVKTELVNSGAVTEAEFKTTETYTELVKKYNRQQAMIYAEGAVFFIILMIWMWGLRRAWRQEIALARQQRNFMLSITHELKSPIAAIRLVLDTILKRNLTKPQLNKFAGNATKDVERLHNLVNNILMAARLESSYHFAKDELFIDEFVVNTIEQMKPKFPNTVFELEIENEHDIPAIRADRMAMTSVILNLLENAIKYTPKNGSVKTTLKYEKNQVVIEVADHGVGIPDDEKQLIFKKFYRVGNEDTRKTKGTGLGLYLVKNIIAAHNGTINVLDNVPNGTIFQVKLPV